MGILPSDYTQLKNKIIEKMLAKVCSASAYHKRGGFMQ